MFIALFAIGKIWKQSKCPSQMKMWGIYIHTHIQWNITQP